jgi:hypothetical protein
MRGTGAPVKIADAQALESFRLDLTQDWLTLGRYVRRFGPPVAALVLAAVLGWAIASSVSNYTHGGWEIHFEQRFNNQILVNIHFHHWYYGIPLFFLALMLIRANMMASTFVFGLGQSLSAHSFLNEHGIPSIFEGGPTWNIPPEVYFSVITAFSLLYAGFLIRREEWLEREHERERIAASYIGATAHLGSTFRRIDNWARRHFSQKKLQHDRDTQIWYGEWRGLDAAQKGEWQMHYTATPYEPETLLWVFSLEHIPINGSVGLIDDWMHELDDALGPALQPILLREPAPSLPVSASGEREWTSTRI